MRNSASVVAAVFCGELWNFLSPPQSQPIVPCFAQAVARRLVFLIQFVALYDLRENSFHRKIVRVDDRVSRANGGGMMRVAGRSHGQTADLRVFESVTIVAAQRGCGVENFDRIDRQRLQSGKTDSGAEQIVGVRRNGETAALMNDIADFARRFSFQIRQLGADTEKMSVGGGHFDSGQNEKIVDRQPVQPHQAFLEQVIDRVAGVVIGDGDAIQTFGARGGDQIFRAGNAVSGKERMRVQVDIKRHGDEVILQVINSSSGYTQLFNKNACFGFAFLLNAIELVIV